MQILNRERNFFPAFLRGILILCFFKYFLTYKHLVYRYFYLRITPELWQLGNTPENVFKIALCTYLLGSGIQRFKRELSPLFIFPTQTPFFFFFNLLFSSYFTIPRVAKSVKLWFVLRNYIQVRSRAGNQQITIID